MDDIYCKAIVKSGPNKGQKCKCRAKQGSYCGRHKSYVSTTSTKSTTKTSIIKQVKKLYKEENYKWIELPEGNSCVDIYDTIPEDIEKVTNKTTMSTHMSFLDLPNFIIERIIQLSGNKQDIFSTCKRLNTFKYNDLQGWVYWKPELIANNPAYDEMLSHAKYIIYEGIDEYIKIVDLYPNKMSVSKYQNACIRAAKSIFSTLITGKVIGDKCNEAINKMLKAGDNYIRELKNFIDVI